MLELRYPHRWQAAGLSMLVTVLAAAMLPDLSAWFGQGPSGGLEGFDKALHFLTFALLTVWFSGQYARQSYWRIWLGLSAFGALIEILQSSVGYRNAEWLDFLADELGIFAGLAVALLGAGGWSLRLERRLDRQYE